LKSPYSRFNPGQLLLGDELALDRTILANERTLLAYLRAGVALMIAGATIIHFSQHGWFMVLGIFCIPLGVTCGIAGVIRFCRMRRLLGALRKSIQG